MAGKSFQATLGALQKSQSQELTFIKLSEPIIQQTATAVDGAQKRTSDISVSTDPQDNPSPAALAADLAHYKELFSKLRFSYLEQVTKEKFLRSIVGDPPQIVDHAENVQLEAQLVEVKAGLKAQKTEVAEMVEDLEKMSKELSRRYENITLQTAQLSALPGSINLLESQLSELQAQLKAHSNSDKPRSQTLPLPATKALLAEKRAEVSSVEKQLRQLQQASERKARELERMRSELRPLEAQRDQAVNRAQDALDRREGGLGADDLEMKGRWYRGVELGLRDMLGVES
ncbi:hypothetical protein MMC25_005777 [Agyrium rufum]|nr:hypothetical protein [Agyrium rufum]